MERLTDRQATAEAGFGGRTTARTGPSLLKVGQVAELLGCSSRTVYRLADSGLMPAPTKLGALVRWSRQAVEEWVAAGCPRCRKGVTR